MFHYLIWAFKQHGLHAFTYVFVKELGRSHVHLFKTTVMIIYTGKTELGMACVQEHSRNRKLNYYNIFIGLYTSRQKLSIF